MSDFFTSGRNPFLTLFAPIIAPIAFLLSGCDDKGAGAATEPDGDRDVNSNTNIDTYAGTHTPAGTRLPLSNSIAKKIMLDLNLKAAKGNLATMVPFQRDIFLSYMIVSPVLTGLSCYALIDAGILQESQLKGCDAKAADKYIKDTNWTKEERTKRLSKAANAIGIKESAECLGAIKALEAAPPSSHGALLAMCGHIYTGEVEQRRTILASIEKSVLGDLKEATKKAQGKEASEIDATLKEALEIINLVQAGKELPSTPSAPVQEDEIPEWLKTGKRDGEHEGGMGHSQSGKRHKGI